MIAHPTNCQIRDSGFLIHSDTHAPPPTPPPAPEARLDSDPTTSPPSRDIFFELSHRTAPPTTPEKKKRKKKNTHPGRLHPLLLRLHPPPQPLLSSGLIAGSVLLCFSQHEKTLSRRGEGIYPPHTKGQGEKKERNCLLQLLCHFFFSAVLKSEHSPLLPPVTPPTFPPHPAQTPHHPPPGSYLLPLLCL